MQNYIKYFDVEINITLSSISEWTDRTNGIAGQLNANMQHNRANGDTSTKIGVMTP